MKNNLDFTRQEFLAYVLLFAAHCNHFESEEELNFILSKIDQTTFDKIHTEVVVDSEEENLDKIQEYISNHKLNQQEKEDLIRDIKNVFFADGTVDTKEKKIFAILKKIIE